MPSLRVKGRAATKTGKSLRAAKIDWRMGLRTLLHRSQVKSAAVKVRKYQAKARIDQGRRSRCIARA